jgi:hypothetical protein
VQTLCKEKELASDLIKWYLNDCTGKKNYRWKWINSGSYRTAYLGPDGNVYKVPLEMHSEFIGENRSEYSNWMRIKDLVFTWCGSSWITTKTMQLFEFPEYGDYCSDSGTLYNPSVIVMPYVSGIPLDECLDGCGAKDIYHCLEIDQAGIYFGMFDISCDNVLVQPNGTRVIIDCQH